MSNINVAQVFYSPIVRLAQSHQSAIPKGDRSHIPPAFLLSYHRNINQCLSLCKVPGTGVKIFRITGFDYKTSSSSVNSIWEFSTKVSVSVISAMPLEYYTSFLVLTFSNNQYSILLIDLKEKRVCSIPLPLAEDVTCGDFDNYRKDLVTGSSNGDVCVYSVRPTAATLKKSEPIQLLFRNKIKIPFGYKVHILDVKTQDLNSLFIVCAKEGLCCVDASTLEVIWLVSTDVFNLTPISISVDKFGCDFLVRCHDNVKKIDVIEYFTPPRSIFASDRGQFSRICIPVDDAIAYAYIETFDDTVGPVISLLTQSLKLRIYRPTTKTREYLLKECSLSLRGSSLEDYNMKSLFEFSYEDRSSAFQKQFDGYLYENCLCTGGIMAFASKKKWHHE